MGDGTKESPYTREDVLKMIREHGGKAEGLDLSGKSFIDGIDLSKLDLRGIILHNSNFVSIVYGVVLTVEILDETEKSVDYSGPIPGYSAAGAKFDGCDLRDADLRGATLNDASFKGAMLNNAKLEGATLSNTELTDGKDWEDIDWGNYVGGEERVGNYNSAISIYRRLKQWYTNAGIYDVAGKFFYREMEARRKALNWKKPHLKLWNWMMRWLCGYGEKPERAIISALVTIFGLAIAYYFWGSFNTASFGETLYYSVVSFTAVGYGNWAPHPAGWAKGVGAAEAFLGTFLMALFLVTFTRKMTR